jgi:peptide-methionine (R)-S-oxide reductase
MNRLSAHWVKAFNRITKGTSMTNHIEKTDRQWRRELTPQEYKVLRKKGTERAFSGAYVHTKQDGIYRCAACGAELFSSGTKFDSDTGWPSFTNPAKSANVAFHEDRSLFMLRTEVTCAACDGHLGHVFNDGPNGADRYCINSVALKLDPMPVNRHRDAAALMRAKRQA